MDKTRIYIDLDNTLGHVVFGPDGNSIAGFNVRPGVDEFLHNLSKYGDLYLLTSGSRPYAEFALGQVGQSAKLFKGLFTKEDMRTFSLKKDEAIWGGGEPPETQPSGWVFDDLPTRSIGYENKSSFIGLDDPNQWIQVDFYSSTRRRPADPNDRGLEKAFAEFKKRLREAQKRPGPEDIAQQMDDE